MNGWLFAGGVVLIVAALFEALVTTLSTVGAGPITGFVTHLLSGAAMKVPHLVGGRKALEATGPIVLLSAVNLWIGMLWAGWFLVFSSDPGAVVNSTTGQPAQPWSRLYFTGYSMATLGNGDYSPVGPLFEISAALTTFSGLFLVTLAITFLVPVLSAVLDKRVLALSIKGLGETPDAIVANAWNGSGFAGLDLLLIPLSGAISRYGERHLAYPMIHYFHGTNAGSSAPLRLAALDEAITLFEHGVDREHRPNPAILSSVRSAITSYLDTLESLYVRSSDDAPPPPALDRLRTLGVPTVEDEAFRKACQQLAERRRLLLATIRSDGWSWEDVHRTSGSLPF